MLISRTHLNRLLAQTISSLTTSCRPTERSMRTPLSADEFWRPTCAFTLCLSAAHRSFQICGAPIISDEPSHQLFMVYFSELNQGFSASTEWTCVFRMLLDYRCISSVSALHANTTCSSQWWRTHRFSSGSGPWSRGTQTNLRVNKKGKTGVTSKARGISASFESTLIKTDLRRPVQWNSNFRVHTLISHAALLLFSVCLEKCTSQRVWWHSSWAQVASDKSAHRNNPNDMVAERSYLVDSPRIRTIWRRTHTRGSTSRSVATIVSYWKLILRSAARRLAWRSAAWSRRRSRQWSRTGWRTWRARRVPWMGVWDTELMSQWIERCPVTTFFKRAFTTWKTSRLRRWLRMTWEVPTVLARPPCWLRNLHGMTVSSDTSTFFREFFMCLRSACNVIDQVKSSQFANIVDFRGLNCPMSSFFSEFFNIDQTSVHQCPSLFIPSDVFRSHLRTGEPGPRRLEVLVTINVPIVVDTSFQKDTQCHLSAWQCQFIWVE